MESIADRSTILTQEKDMPKMPRHSVVILLIWGCVLAAGCGQKPLGTGNALPPLQVAGWTNGDPPESDDLLGKVIVLNVFASW